MTPDEPETTRPGRCRRGVRVAAYRWDPNAPPGAELRRIARTQVDRAIAELDLDDRDAAVHQVRRRSKKLRALLRLVRPVARDLHDDENPTIRDLARRLAGARDQAASLGALEDLAKAAGDGLARETMTEVRRGLTVVDGLAPDPEAALSAARTELAALRVRIEQDWTVPDDVAAAEAVAPGFRRSYARGRDALGEVLDEPTPEAWHEWRKRVKDHWYHCRLLRPLWPPVLKARASALSDLSDLLGDDHDLVVLRTTLHADPDRFGGEVVTDTMTAFADRRRDTLQREALSLGRRVYADRPKAVERRIVIWWDAASGSS